MKRYLLDTSLVAAFLHGRKHIIELIDHISFSDTSIG
jgi:hypothetical protein